MNATKQILEMPHLTKTVQCGKCGREITVGKNTILGYCRECSSRLGEKR